MTATSQQGLPALRREVLVAAEPSTAFAVFTEHIGAWWPLGRHSVHGAGGTVAFVEPGPGARIVESKEGAEDAVWGTVTRWEPVDLLAFTWHPGNGPEAASQVTVTFAPAGDQTLVTLEHAGWEVFGEHAAEARTEYDHGWPVVLDCYLAHVAAG